MVALSMAALVCGYAWHLRQKAEQAEHETEKIGKDILWDAVGKLSMESLDERKRAGYDHERNLFAYWTGSDTIFRQVKDGMAFEEVNMLPLYHGSFI